MSHLDFATCGVIWEGSASFLAAGPGLAGSLTWEIRCLINAVGSALADHLSLHAFYIGSVVATPLQTGCRLSQLGLLRFLSLL